MIYHVEKAYFPRCLSYLLRNGLPVLQLFAINAGYIDYGDLCGFYRFIGLEMKCLTIQKRDGFAFLLGRGSSGVRHLCGGLT